MSGLELIAVVGCVAAVVSAYNDGSELVRKVRARRKARRALQHATSPDTSTQDLEISLANGQDVVRREYDRHYRRAGDLFAAGDQEACDTLKNIIIHLQGQVILNLKVAWQEDTNVDALSLQDVSDESQDRAILCLIQLHQGLMVAAPITEARYSPPLPISRVNQGFIDTSPSRVDSWTTQSSVAGPSRSSTGITIESDQRKSGRFSGIFRKPKTVTEDSQPRVAEYPQEAPTRDLPPVPLKDDQQNGNLMMGLGLARPSQQEQLSNRSRVSSVSDRHSSIAEAESPESDPFFDPWKGVPSPREEVHETQPFNRSNRVSLEPETFLGHRASIGPDTIPDHGSALGHRSSQSSSHSWVSKLSRDSISSHRNSQASNHSWRPPTISESASNACLSQASVGQISTMSLQGPPGARQTIMPTGSSKGFLPTEDNDFAGFCKGAWRLQIGEKKKAIEEIKRPGSMYAMSSSWKCSRCHFEGRMTRDARGKKSVDTRVYGANCITYRWEFLFKCHVQLKDALPNTMESTFGCIFCCAEGKGTPIFGGVKAFLAHMQEHRARPPTGEVLYRMSCVVGRTPGQDEAFDIALPAV